ncbi:MAG TPA: sugar phosphate nucleotidyltransferase [Candidatus Methylomirabilis sp.]|nr:sugar phosphate nucleotidyltransferase [Candidatus Methylomirabilis sp.]
MLKMMRTAQHSAIRHGAPVGEPIITKTSPQATGLDRTGDSRLWAIVLAGGQGVRLRPLVSRIYGDERPKQYAALLDSRTLLEHTLDRVALLVEPKRTVVVTMQDHDRYMSRYVLGEADSPSHPHVLWQPEDRGTAAGVLLPAHWICARDPRAVVAVFPSDHFIREEAAFMGYVAEIAAFVGHHREWIVLLGVQPTDAETEYGWIEPGERVAWTARGPLYRIRRFEEKPSCHAATSLLTSGGLWNTFVLVASVSALIKAGQECVPDLHDRLAYLRAFAGTEHEAWAIRQAYTCVPRANFSRSVLEVCPGPLAVAKVPGLSWCDLGTPARVARTLNSLGMSPPWA